MKRLMILLVAVVWAGVALAADSLDRGFADPPLQARTRAYWWWLCGNVDKAAITKDLEWMKKIGMGGGLIFHADGRAGVMPRTGVAFGSPEFRELFKHAVREADRLGLELTLSPQSGWNLGGPMVTPDQAAKHITWSEAQVLGPRSCQQPLPLPPCRDKFYRDTRVLAYRIKPGAVGRVPRPEVKASSTAKSQRTDAAVDGNDRTTWTSALRWKGEKGKKGLSATNTEWLEFEFAAPVTLTGLRILSPGLWKWQPRKGELQVQGEDGVLRSVAPFASQKKGVVEMAFPAVSGKTFRLVFHEAFDRWPDAESVSVGEVVFLDAEGKPLDFGKPLTPVYLLESKAMYEEAANATVTDPLPYKPGDEDARPEEVIDLTAKLDKDGTLRWDVPEGTWQVFRFGCTVNSGRVSFSCAGWTGYVVNYLDPEALRAYWRQVVDPLLDDIQPYLGKAFKGFETDSWEGGGINWTARLPEEFRQRRGYDPLPFLPVFAGRIIQSREASNRFLYDWRKTVGDLMAENHYGVMANLAAERGLMIHCEAGGPHAGPFDAIKNWGRCTWPMGEFWVQSPHRSAEDARFFMKGPASAAHLYGKPVACGEGFTSVGPHWDDTLWSSQKPTFDHEACAGLNLTYWHAFTCSPASMGVPGQEYFAGTHFNPQITWANQAHGFIGYLDRCQFLLQQGQFVADVCYYYGDHVPNVPGRKQTDPAKVLPTYDYDYLNEEMLLQMQVRAGRLVVPCGMSYRLLALPDLKVLSLPALRKVRELARAGAAVVGPRPQCNPSLSGGAAADQEFAALCEELWGQGQVLTKPAKDVLAKLGVPPDFEAREVQSVDKLDYLHRRDGQAEIYFLSNQAAEAVKFTGVFRVSGKQPELWDAVTGQTRPAGQFQPVAGRTAVPLELAPYGSLFVVFRHPATQAPAATAGNFPALSPVQTLEGDWTVRFDPKWGGPEKPVTFAKLEDWTARPEEGIKYYSGTATYRKSFDLPSPIRNPKSKIFLDLGAVKEMAEVRLNGKSLGVVWCPPWRVEITEAVKSAGNELEIDVVNNWPNRLIGDGKLPPEKRIAKTHYTGWYNPGKDGKEQTLFPSGLLGPVRVMSQE